MCGRYYWDDQTYAFISDMADETSEEDKQEFCPGQDIPILIIKDHKMVMEKYHWGYTMAMSSQLVINARCETILDKKMFQDDILKRRCLIPAKGFYERDSLKHQVSFEKSEDVIWMAGIYRDKEKEVTIITTKANQTMKSIHSRMPLMIQFKDIKKWLTDNTALTDFLSAQDEDLKIVSGTIQQSLFDI